MMDEEAAYREEMIGKFEEYSSKSLEIANTVNDIQKTRDDKELEQFNARQEKKKKAVADRLADGEINEQEANTIQKKIEEDGAKHAAKVQREAAIRNKFIRLFEATINASAAIAKAAVTGDILSAIAAGTAVGAIAATPLPKAARGRLITGRSHAEGGEIIEAERGEAIINAEATSRNLPLLDEINRSTGGVSLMTGGFAERQQTAQAQNAMTTQMLTSAFTAAAMQIQPVVSVEQISRVNKQVNVIQGRATN